MNINQLLILALILYIFVTINDNYEGFEGDINVETCLQRILDYGCIESDLRDQITDDCEALTIPMPYGETNITCDNTDLFNWLVCQQMIRNGACECNFGREQINSLCGSEPLNLTCPLRLSSPSNEVFDKIKELEEITLTCENVEKREQKVNEITQELDILLQDMENQGMCFGNYLSIVLIIVIVLIIGFFFAFASKNK